MDDLIKPTEQSNHQKKAEHDAQLRDDLDRIENIQGVLRWVGPASRQYSLLNAELTVALLTYERHCKQFNMEDSSFISTPLATQEPSNGEPVGTQTNNNTWWELLRTDCIEATGKARTPDPYNLWLLAEVGARLESNPRLTLYRVVRDSSLQATYLEMRAEYCREQGKSNRLTLEKPVINSSEYERIATIMYDTVRKYGPPEWLSRVLKSLSKSSK